MVDQHVHGRANSPYPKVNKSLLKSLPVASEVAPK